MRYNKYYNRSGVIFRFRHKGKKGKLSSYFIFTKSKFDNKYVYSDFGGGRDSNIDPLENAWKEFVEESTFVSDININPSELGMDYISDNSFLRKNDFDKVVKSLKDDGDYHVLYNEQRSTLNYLYIVDLGIVDGFRWNGKDVKMDGDYQEIDVSGSINGDEIDSFIIMRRKHFIENFSKSVGNKSKTYFRYLIWDTIIKNFNSIEVVDQVISSELSIPDKLNKFNDEKEKYKTEDKWDKDVRNTCDKTLVTNKVKGDDMLNDKETLNFQCFEIKKDAITGIRYIEIPKDYNFYKSMNPTSLGNSDFENTYASSPVWYGDLMTSMSYIPWAKEKYDTDWKLYVFKTLRPIKLMLLLDTFNIG